MATFWRRPFFVAIYLFLFFGACSLSLFAALVGSAHSVEELVLSTADSTAPYSNILPADYVGPQVCGECHEENYAHWQRHPHSKMNALVSAETVLGDFSGVEVEYGGGRAVFSREGEDFVVEYYRGGTFERKFKIMRVIGWRYEQDYVAVQVKGPEPADDLLYREEIRLRFSYSLEKQRWFPQSYMEPTEYQGSEYLANKTLRYDPFEPDRVSFNKRCSRCHNTYPYDLRLYKIYTKNGMLSGFAPGPGLSPQVVKALASAQGDLDLLGKEGLPVERFVTVGISCESCHFGGREHAENAREIRFVPTHPLLEKWTPDHEGAREEADIVNAICRQCHHSGIGAEDNWPDGSASVNSMEAVEMDRGACQGQLRCTHCHSTHERGPEAGAPDRQQHIDACLSCHLELREEAALRAHSRHETGQVSCLDCHMPRIVQGFKVYNRTHRISSPNEPHIIATGMPNACNLCHLDKSLLWTRDELAKGWGQHVELSSLLEKQFGPGLSKATGEVWLQYPFSMARTVAAGAYARSDSGAAALPRMIEHLGEDNAYVRMRFLQDIERIVGRELTSGEYDVMATPAVRKRQVENLLKKRMKK
ncbi:MAG: ammonia-forming cytochrome c nitrite reductase subunit c552 [Candidatus Latescibacterota bacterium]|jgi:hypothetical protein